MFLLDVELHLVALDIRAFGGFLVRLGMSVLLDLCV